MLRLATLRSHDQYNTPIYSLDDRYRGVFGGRMVVFMNEADMRSRGIAEGDVVEIESLAEDGKRRIVGGFWAKPHSISVASIGAYYPANRCCLYRGIVQQKQRLPIYLVPVVEKSEAHTAMTIIVNIAINRITVIRDAAPTLFLGCAPT
jgi:anaerobic selenocysteine-containing dehydrogenase